MDERWVVRRAEDGPVLTDITPNSAGWEWCGLRVITLEPGASVTIDTLANELLVVPLVGAADVRCGAQQARLSGRESVFSAITDVVYVGRDRQVDIASPSGGRFALAAARSGREIPFRHVRSHEIVVELRGAGSSSRQVNGLCLPGGVDADRLIVLEVLTPGGNWAGFPPSKHDEERDGECALEEIAYFEVRADHGGDPVAFQRIVASDERPIDVLAEVRTGDVVLAPYGWVGPTMAMPGNDVYSLHVLAGPRRAWLTRDDPAYAWVRQTWTTQVVDPRLPLIRSPRPQAGG